jgi:hypothetical protein
MTERPGARRGLRVVVAVVLLLGLAACATQHPNRDPLGEVFPSVTGESLEGETVRIPDDFAGRPVVLLVGYKQDSQFDIDRWLIGLDMTETRVDVYELPTIPGLFPRMFSTVIDDGMRAGIPKELWKGVITVYEDGAAIQVFTGSENPNNARCLLIDASGSVVYFHDRGFSVDALNALREMLQGLES